MKFKKEYLKLGIVERLEKLRVIYYGEPLLGSGGYDYGEEDYLDIKGEDDLEYRVYSEDEGDFDDIYFDEWFSDCDGFEIEDNGDGGDYGYYKLVVDKENKSIKIMAVPCVFTNAGCSSKRIWGFDWENGELVREMSNIEVKEMLRKDKKAFCG